MVVSSNEIALPSLDNLKKYIDFAFQFSVPVLLLQCIIIIFLLVLVDCYLFVSGKYAGIFS